MVLLYGWGNVFWVDLLEMGWSWRRGWVWMERRWIWVEQRWIWVERRWQVMLFGYIVWISFDRS